MALGMTRNTDHAGLYVADLEGLFITDLDVDTGDLFAVSFWCNQPNFEALSQTNNAADLIVMVMRANDVFRCLVQAVERIHDGVGGAGIDDGTRIGGPVTNDIPVIVPQHWDLFDF
jgi:hypothetical protein